MERELKIHKLEPVLIEPDQIGLDIEAALIESDDGVDFAVPNVTFEVRIGVRKVYEKKSDAKTGEFSAKNVAVGAVESQFDVVISARDSVSALTVRVQMNVENVMRQIEERRRAAEESERAKVEEEERRRAEARERAKVEEEARRNRWGKAGPASPEEAEAERSAEEEAEKQRQIKVEIAEALKHISKNHYSLDSQFKTLLKRQDHPATRRGMLEAANELPRELTNNIKYFFEAVWAEEVISVLVHRNPAAVLEKFPIFYKCSWSRNIVMQIAVESPLEAFAGIGQYEYQPWAREVALEAAARDPDAAIKFHANYQDQTWAGDVMELAREEKVRKDEAKKQNEEARRLAVAEEKARQEEEKARREAEKEAAKWTREGLMRRAGNDPHGVMMDFEKFGNESWAMDVVSVVARTGGRTAFGISLGFNYIHCDFHKFSDKPWAAAVYELAIGEDFWYAFERADFSHPVLGKMYEKLASAHPKEFLINYKPPIGYYGSGFRMWTDLVKSTTDDSILDNALTTHHGESKKMLFRRLVAVNPQKAIDYFCSLYSIHGGNAANYRELRALIITEFPHLLALIPSNCDIHVASLEEEAGRANPLFAVQKFFRDLLK